jgi:anti-anti-sigma factor
MKIIRRDVGDVTILDLQGEITTGDNALYREIVMLKREGRLKLLLNLENLTHADPEGFSEILHAWRDVTGTAQNVTGRLKILSPRGQVEDFLTETKLLRVLEAYENEDKALRSFLSSPAS